MNESNSRRAFLGRGAAVTGGVLLALNGVASADGKDEKDAKAKDDVVVKMSEHGDLAKVGGSEIIDTAAGKVIVAHVAADKFVACSAICTHKGCEVGYSHDEKQFVCPCHFATYALDGKVTRGPAKKDLKSYATDAATVISLDVK